MNAKQKRFTEEYVVDLNATQAAIRAGYSPRSAGSQAFDLLKKPEIQECIQHEMDARSARTNITKDKVLREMARVGFANCGRILNDATGGLLEGLSDDDLAAVASVKTRLVSNEDGEAVVEREVRFHDKAKFVEMMAKHLGMFTEKVDMNVHTPVRIINNIPRVKLDDDDGE